MAFELLHSSACALGLVATDIDVCDRRSGNRLRGHLTHLWYSLRRVLVFGCFHSFMGVDAGTR